jgi:hypothetical protein
MLYYNKTMADAAGLTAPTTMEELEAFAKALYKVDDNGEVQVWGFECLKDFGYFNAGTCGSWVPACLMRTGPNLPAWRTAPCSRFCPTGAAGG